MPPCISESSRRISSSVGVARRSHHERTETFHLLPLRVWFAPSRSAFVKPIWPVSSHTRGSTPRSGGNHVRILTQLIITAGLLATVMMPKAQAEDDDPKVRKSVVKITASIRTADYFRPWTKNSP